MFSKKFLPIVLIAAVIVEYLLSTYLKYSVNGLSIVEYDLFYIGNFISLIPNLLFIIGFIVLKFLNKSSVKEYSISYVIFVVLCISPLIISFFIDRFVTDNSRIIFGLSLVKVVYISLLSIGKFALIYLVSLIWSQIFYSDKIILLRSLIITAVIVFLMFTFSLFFNLKFKSNPIIPEGKNIAIVFGAAVWSGDKPSPMFKARIDRSSELFMNRKVAAIQVTGGNAPGELSEAQTALNRLIELGVPQENILFEELTSNTNEQVNFLYTNLTELKNKYNSIVLVSDSFHLPRISTICNFFGISAVPHSSKYQLNWEKLLYFRIRESLALLLFWNFGI